MSDLPKRLRIKAGMIALGERIAWGSDTALMEEAADVIEALSASVENHQLHMLGMARDRDQLRALLSEQQQASDKVPCKTHPDAPHGFCRNSSHSEGRYVCECEHWEEPQASAAQEKDVHTEHCCKQHGCKYNDPACTVACGDKVQSFPCEDCDEGAREQASAAQSAPVGMTAERAAYFMRRFKHEEKLLGPNEQAAIDYVLAMLAAQSAPAGEREALERELLSVLDFSDSNLRLVVDHLLEVGYSRAAWQRTQAAGVPDGWRLVPVEPTPEMMRAGVLESVGALRVYYAMLAACKGPDHG